MKSLSREFMSPGWNIVTDCIIKNQKLARELLIPMWALKDIHHLISFHYGTKGVSNYDRE